MSGHCIVSDIVRSDTGQLADPNHACAAPLGALSSELFCRSVRELRILDRQTGWQDSVQRSLATFLFVFQCDTTIVRPTHDFTIKRMISEMPQPGECEITAGHLQKQSQLMIIESEHELACVSE